MCEKCGYRRYRTGYLAGLDEGFEMGYSEGIENCPSQNCGHYDEGYDEGFNEGYDIGYSKGMSATPYTRVREERIYVRLGNTYIRGYKVFFGDLGLIGAMEYIPLDKNYGKGNVDIIEWTKLHSVKGLRFIGNKIQNILYIVDKVFKSEEEMNKDIEEPTELDISLFLQQMLDADEDED